MMFTIFKEGNSINHLSLMGKNNVNQISIAINELILNIVKLK